MKKRWKKRGAIEIQFNWVFVLIVGVIILAFFTKVTFTQEKVSKTKISASIMKNLDTITVGASSSRDTVQLIDIPDVDLTITSTDDCQRTYEIDSNKKFLVNTIIFSPGRIKGTQIISWTKDWNFPYKVTNLVYMTSPYVRYIIDNSQNYQLAHDVYINLPEETQKEESNGPGLLDDYNNYKVRLVTFGNDPNAYDLSNLDYYDDKEITAVKIVPHVNNSRFGKMIGNITFYEKSGNFFVQTGESYYITEEGIYAAIYSWNPDIYNCNMKAAFERLKFVSQLYLNRTTLLYNEYQNDLCEVPYYYACCTYPPLPAPKIFRLMQRSNLFSFTFPPTGPNKLSDIKEMYHYAYGTNNEELINMNDGIEPLNDYALRNSCPEMY